MPVEKDVMIKSIGGVTIPEPGLLAVETIDDISDKDAGRSMGGHMWKGYIGSYRKLDLSAPSMRSPGVATLMQAVKGKNAVSVTFYDWESGQEVTRYFYAGQRTLTPLDFRGPNKRLAQVAFTLTEVDLYT